ncbi:MAG: sigma-54-dependent Fis family transcriptional regulator [Prevotella sp.]|nr:sigma-54-dependent Fis family transcriptional regulator [Prevotella sp.]MBR0268657.1 sigma-54-dependent Fis family transcriptional regulator [Prevotella sp.]
MILVVDDDKTIRLSLKLILERNEYEVALAEGPKEAVQIVRNTPAVELVLMDMNYSMSTDGEEGLTLLKQVKVFRPDVPCILMTAWGTIDLAVQGMRAGAFDFITKPWDNGVLLERIETARSLTPDSLTPDPFPKERGVYSSSAENLTAKGNHSPLLGRGAGGEAFGRGAGGEAFGRGVGGEAFSRILATVARVAPTNAPVLITGESGTGKELIAEAIHRQSRRANGPFVKVNLGGISTSLFESEMFGHKKGSFTDAKADRTGRFEMAKGGTIFLDEIGELSLASQVKLLRVLQDQTYEVLGDSQTRRTDVRVVCATNADLRAMVEEKTFREDLFYRINIINIHLPPLRDRREDIPLLVDHFLREACAANSLPLVSASSEAIGYLQALPFPGNVRELKNLVERVLLMRNPDSMVLDKADFALLSSASGCPSVLSTKNPATLDTLERNAIAASIAKHNGNLSLVAKELGISRGALYRKIEKHGL